MQLNCQHDRAEEYTKAQLASYRCLQQAATVFQFLTPNFRGFFSSIFLSPFLGLYERPFEQIVEASDVLSAMFALCLAVEVTST